MKLFKLEELIELSRRLFEPVALRVSSSRSLLGLALAGDLQLHPTHADDGLHVLHAGDAALPTVTRQEAGGCGRPAFPAGARRPGGMGVRSHRGRLPGESEGPLLS